MTETVVAGQPHIEAHDPRHRAEPDLLDQTLKKDTPSLIVEE